MRYMFIYLALLPAMSWAHGGALDSKGGHRSGRDGAYHCHKPGCNGSAANANATAALDEAKAEGRAYSRLYDREEWKHWSDFDGDCMNTRHEMLLEQAVGSVSRSPDGCFISAGVWNDPYSGEIFTRSSRLDVDHIVPLKWAHGHGGDRWSPMRKQAFANDPRNLLVVSDKLNQQKGARGPTEWMPPNHAYRCRYLELWVNVLHAYPDLKMIPAERRVFDRQLSSCGLS